MPSDDDSILSSDSESEEETPVVKRRRLPAKKMVMSSAMMKPKTGSSSGGIAVVSTVASRGSNPNPPGVVRRRVLLPSSASANQASAGKEMTHAMPKIATALSPAERPVANNQCPGEAASSPTDSSSTAPHDVPELERTEIAEKRRSETLNISGPDEASKDAAALPVPVSNPSYFKTPSSSSARGKVPKGPSQEVKAASPASHVTAAVSIAKGAQDKDGILSVTESSHQPPSSEPKQQNKKEAADQTKKTGPKQPENSPKVPAKVDKPTAAPRDEPNSKAQAAVPKKAEDKEQLAVRLGTKEAAPSAKSGGAPTAVSQEEPKNKQLQSAAAAPKSTRTKVTIRVTKTTKVAASEQTESQSQLLAPKVPKMPKEASRVPKKKALKVAFSSTVSTATPELAEKNYQPSLDAAIDHAGIPPSSGTSQKSTTKEKGSRARKVASKAGILPGSVIEAGAKRKRALEKVLRITAGLAFPWYAARSQLASARRRTESSAGGESGTKPKRRRRGKAEPGGGTEGGSPAGKDGDDKGRAKARELPGGEAVLPPSFGKSTSYECYDAFVSLSPPDENSAGPNGNVGGGGGGLGIKFKNIEERAVVRGFAPWRLGSKDHPLSADSAAANSGPAAVKVGGTLVRINDVVVSVNNFDARGEHFGLVIEKLRQACGAVAAAEVVCLRLARPLIDAAALEALEAEAKERAEEAGQGAKADEKERAAAHLAATRAAQRRETEKKGVLVGVSFD
mmetsp:Transcript_36713/g.82252  ORF Transcript_36713/g.82252 Transcript_36713/m.82252 type:complete len:737 (+) Transcript_36713:97-2307(+)